MPTQYPFSAVVGSDQLALALVLTTISPEIGGVLVRGEKGTAKSTIVRALAGVLPPIEVVRGDRFSSAPGEESPDGVNALDADTETRPVRLVELPVGATEDRVLGSLHLERALSEGRAEYEPGLLARAHRGLLYVDEVNLLHDHLVDLLLDAAAMGRSTVERDGVSVSHAARFVLVGTMNPEEGELRPQLLDRFGLTVEVRAPRDPAYRVEVVRRRLAFDADPAAFVASYAEEERALTDRIAAARKLAGEVELDDAMLLRIAEVCAAYDVDGMRADIVMARTATAHAAWEGRTSVTAEDLRVAALLALPHRRRRNPFDAPGLDEDLLDQLLEDDDPDPDPDGGGDGGGDGQPTQAESPMVEEGAPRPSRDPASGPPESTTTTGAGDPRQARLFTVRGVGHGEQGRRSRALTDAGRRIGASREASGPLHLTETIRAAAPHQHARGRTAGRVVFRAEDLRTATREGQESNLVLFCVDASGSMSSRRRMGEVKTAILSLLLDAYRRRDKVGLVTFRGTTAELVLPPTRSVDVAAARLEDVPAGGRTPLDRGLLEAARVLELERVRDPRRRPLLVVVTDGRATNGTDAVRRSREVAEHLTRTGVSALVVDCETGSMRMGLAHALSVALGAEHVPLGEVTSEALQGAVESRVA